MQRTLVDRKLKIAKRGQHVRPSELNLASRCPRELSERPRLGYRLVFQ